MRVNVAGQMRSTLPADDDHPYRTGAVAAEPRRVRRRPTSTSIGDDPRRPRRRLPAQHREPGARRRSADYHPFDGDGMLHMMPFRGRAGRLPQPLRAHRRLRGRERGRRRRCGPASPSRRRSRCATDGWGARTRMKDASSTDVVVHAGRRARRSFYQCGDLYRLDPLTLEQLGRETLGRPLPAPRASRRTPRSTSTPASCCSSTTRRPRRTCTTASSTPTTSWSTTIDVPLPGPRLPHDMAFTEHYAILNDCPLFWDPELLAQGVYAVALPPRAADPLRGHPAPRRHRRHPLVRGRPDLRPALDQRLRGRRRDRPRRLLPGRPEPVAARRPTTLLRAHRSASSTLDRMQTAPHRWRFNLATGATHARRTLSDRIMEFGMINGTPRRPALPLHVQHDRPNPGWFLFDGLVKHDLQTGARGALRASATACSPARRRWRRAAARRGEDDGYLVTFITDMNARPLRVPGLRRRRHLRAGPIARVAPPRAHQQRHARVLGAGGGAAGVSP